MLRNRDPSTIQIRVACPRLHTGPTSNAESQASSNDILWANVTDGFWDDVVVRGKPTHLKIIVKPNSKEKRRRESWTLLAFLPHRLLGAIQVSSSASFAFVSEMTLTVSLWLIIPIDLQKSYRSRRYSRRLSGSPAWGF